MRIAFEPLSETHLPTLTRWLQRPHVCAFWDDGERDMEAVRAHHSQAGRDVPGFIFSVDGQAAGFIQRERVTLGHDFLAWASSDGETWAMDLLIGEAELTGLGPGPRVIRAFMHELRAERPGLRRVLIDPVPENARAIRAYTKAGFAPVAVVNGEDGPVQLMWMNLPTDP